jgi:hypothetical protein
MQFLTICSLCSLMLTLAGILYATVFSIVH